MKRRAALRPGFSLVEVIVAITLLVGVLLGFASFSQQMWRANQGVTARAFASDLSVARLEQIKGNRNYGALVATYNNQTETWPSTSPNAGYTRQTFVTRTGPTAQHDYVTVTVVVSGRGLSPAVRRTTSIAAF
jgi:prepilin-type N-terminal cleavage/methylation domain-containing protein